MTVDSVPLGEIATIVMGQSPPGSTYNRVGNGVPLLNGPAEFGERHPTPVQWTTEPSRYARKGDILFCVRGATTGRKCWSDQSYAIGRGLAAIRGRDGVCNTQFLWFLLDVVTYSLLKRAAGSTFVNLPGEQLLNFSVPLPPLKEQDRIAAKLTEAQAAVDKARRAAQERLAAAEALPAAYLRAVFGGPEAHNWPRKQLSDVAELLPSKSIATEGDTEVQAITTACLGESGFMASGVKSARMWAADAAVARVQAGEVLIARSNTPDLVGRVSMYPGTPSGLVASDLTIRLWTNADVSPPFLTAYLSFLYLTRYWKERAGGASGSMKKITRSQILEESIPAPAPDMQESICKQLSDQTNTARRIRTAIEEEFATIEALPAVLLRQAFAGERE